MKKIYSTLAAVVLTASMFLSQHANAQAPEKMSYQAVIRNSSDVLVTNAQVGMQISILQGSVNGTVVYTETQTPNTNANGLVSVEIGSGPDFSTIDWANDIYFIKTETDPTGGTNYTITGTNQLLSVPYALYAKTSGSSTAGPQGPAGNDGADGATGPQGPQGPSGSSTGWSLLGDAGTVDGTDFIGTTDNVPFNIRVNNEKAGRIDPVLENTFFGYQAGNSNTTGGNNTANGYQALYSNTVGGKNTANGYQAFYSNNGGGFNVANGYQALYNNISGYHNIATGYLSLFNNTTGLNNTACGSWALYSNLTGNNNTAYGYQALFSNTIGIRNIANGYEALRSNTEGNGNIAIGYQALWSNSIGYENTGTGYQALYANIDGEKNTANGYQALYSNTGGNWNTASGHNALYNNTTGEWNTASGIGALFSNITGLFNTAIGSNALQSNTEGKSNTAVGMYALWNNITGEHNTALGFSAFSSNTGPFSNSTALGYNAEPGASNTIRLGNNFVSTIGGYANWTNVSDGRFKVDVQENVAGLEFIVKLRPVTYHLDMDAIAAFTNTPDSLRLPDSEKLKAAELQVGFIAQEVEAAANELNFDFHGVDVPKNETSHYGLRYAEFVPPLVKAMQEQQEMIEELRKEIEVLKRKAN